MAALDYLRRAGLTVESVADRLRVSPVERITDPIRHFIREHLAELQDELGVLTSYHSNGGNIAEGFIAPPDWHYVRDRYIDHLMRCRACYAPTSRYCKNGAMLRACYNEKLNSSAPKRMAAIDQLITEGHAE